MLKCTINEKTLREFIDSISTITDECRIHINANEISTTAIDPANVALARVKLSKSGFIDYLATPSEMCISLNKIHNVLLNMHSDEYEVLFTESSKKLQIDGGGYTFKTTLIADASIKKDPTTDPTTIPLSTHLQIKGSDFSNSVRAVSAVSDKIAFKYNHESGIFSIFSISETESVNRDLTKEKIVAIKKESSESTFSLDYINKISKIIAKTEVLNIHMGKNMPIRLEFSVGSLNDPINVIYVVAPRIEQV
jgi:proliferating cell nuclear antigen